MTVIFSNVISVICCLILKSNGHITSKFEWIVLYLLIVIYSEKVLNKTK